MVSPVEGHADVSPRAASRRTRADAELFDVVIIGAGISGVGAAIRLRQAGLERIVVLEKADGIGGTWRDNTYPGCACDVPSALYSYSFAQKADWSRVFAPQAEIAAYVHETAERHGVIPNVRFGEGVDEARWMEAERCWEVRSSKRSYRGRYLVSCVGYLHEPIVPEIPGLAAFPGKVFHSSRWDHGHDLRGRRVAVIGTGASAIQFVPQIQPLAKTLHLFQRTPQWILPKPDAAVGLLLRSMLRLPGAKNAARRVLHRQLERLGVAFRHPEQMKAVQSAALLHLKRSVRDPALRSKLTPRYVIGCKRLLLSNDYYPAVAKPNVEVLATGVQRVSGHEVVGSDGEARQVDTIILGTGFHVTDPPMATRVRGADGRSLAEVWAGSPEAYRGTSTAGFPNAFGVLGPNLAIGHNSAFLVIEAQLDYIVDALRTAKKQGLSRIEVRRSAQAAYNRQVQKDLMGTVWNTGGCSSYYIDANGKNSVAFPWSTDRMRRMLRTFDAENYLVASDIGAEPGTKPGPEETLHAI